MNRRVKHFKHYLDALMGFNADTFQGLGLITEWSKISSDCLIVHESNHYSFWRIVRRFVDEINHTPWQHEVSLRMVP